MIFRFRLEKCRAQRYNRAIQDKEIRAKQSKDRIAELLEEKCDVMIAPHHSLRRHQYHLWLPGHHYHRHR